MGAKTQNIAKKGENIARKTGETISKNPKTTLYIVGGILAIYLGYKILSGINKGISTVSDVLTGDIVDNNIETGNSIIVDDNITTIDHNQATLFASELLEAFNHMQFNIFLVWSHGSDEDVIESIFDRINSEDFKLIYKAFGLKHYNGFGSPSSNIGGGIQVGTGIAEERDLVYWLNAELSSFWDRSLYKKVKRIVEGAGFIFV